MIRPVLAAVFALGLASCSAAPLPPAEGVGIARDVVLVLPSPDDLGRSVEVMQMVTARRGDETHVFEARLSVNRERLLLVGTDSLGRRAMTIQWRAGQVTMDKSSWVPDALRPENILADIVLLYWPEPVLARSLRGAQISSDAGGRTIGKIIHISRPADPWNGQSHLVNGSFGYELDVQSVTVAP
ncbi:MAG: DUF3261 domain-containing protein [Magnetospirillum gryphiswaldense]|nr:DUF3261 domain-containing protein [Magnetospirillum gryphiswaldense]